MEFTARAPRNPYFVDYNSSSTAKKLGCRSRQFLGQAPAFSPAAAPASSSEHLDAAAPPASSWRGARTTFIPKKNPAQDPSDFRPIAVGPVVRKLFHQILAKRARAAAALDFRQRAFQPMNGCAENILLLSTALKEARQKLRLLYLASIDMAKAFDRVSTEAILRGALWNQFDDSFMAYLK